MAQLELERHDDVLLIVINRPETRNAINVTIARGIASAVEQLDESPDLRVGVITGAGGYFSAGMDLKAFGATGERPHVDGRGFAGIVGCPPEKPIVAAIEGFAIAGGLEIALARDLVVAASDARLGWPEVKLGLVAGGGLVRLAQTLPQALVMELALTGEPLDATRAAEIGLVNAVTPPGGAKQRALAMAAQIAANAPLALAATKTIIRESPRWPQAEVTARQREIADAVIASGDAKEGALAFAEKRRPRWRGK